MRKVKTSCHAVEVEESQCMRERIIVAMPLRSSRPMHEEKN